MLILFTLLTSMAWSTGFSETESELKRLDGFRSHQQATAEFDLERSKNTEEIAKKRRQWVESVENGIPDYKAWKSRQQEAPEEGSAAWREDQRKKQEQDRDLETARDKYAAQKKKNNPDLKRPFPEELEYGIPETAERVDPKKRALFTAKGGSSSRSSGGFSGGGSSPPPIDEGAPPPPMDYGNSAPPSGGGEPDFYEPEIPPPPPPPPEGAFDEAVPPPVFDDPEL